jgi:hypothetical protein
MLEPARIGTTESAEMSNRREGLRRRGRGVCRRSRPPVGVVGLPRKRFDLCLESTPPGVELEQNGLGGFAREPQLAALWIPADAVCGDRGRLRAEERIEGDDRKIGEGARVAIDEHDNRPEPFAACALDELEALLGSGGEHRGGAVSEGRCDCSLGPWSELEGLQREPLACLGQSTRGRGQAFAFCE